MAGQIDQARNRGRWLLRRARRLAAPAERDCRGVGFGTGVNGLEMQLMMERGRSRPRAQRFDQVSSRWCLPADSRRLGAPIGNPIDDVAFAHFAAGR